jgi:hypothetical protein
VNGLTRTVARTAVAAAGGIIGVTAGPAQASPTST